jgi:hypothetical protein
MRQEHLYSLIPVVIYHMLPKHFDFEPIQIIINWRQEDNLLQANHFKYQDSDYTVYLQYNIKVYIKVTLDGKIIVQVCTHCLP